MGTLLRVVEITPGGVAERAGLVLGDLLVQFGSYAMVVVVK